MTTLCMKAASQISNPTLNSDVNALALDQKAQKWVTLC